MMTRFTRIAFVLACSIAGARSAEVRSVNVCSLTSDPATYSGQMVSVRAYLVTDYHGTFIGDRKCKKLILLVLPEGASLAPKISLKEDDAYKRFDEALHDYRPGTSQPRKRIEARFTGRFEYLVQREGSTRFPESVRSPLGAHWQLVLESVSGVRLW